MIAYLDCSSGISGDKFLAALLDAGQTDQCFTPAHLDALIGTLGLDEASVHTERVVRGGISGLHVVVETGDGAPTRHWRDIRTMLERAELPENARRRALEAFERLALVEAGVHGVDPESVHFHEVGATDSIVDVVGVSLGLVLLGVESLVCSFVALGSGRVHAAHGDLPVPAPATLELLLGLPIETGAGRGELTTPTGAALVATNADAFGPMPPMTVSRIGYGAGSREIEGLPNVARIALGHSLASAPGPPAEPTGPREEVVLLETVVDHLPAEELAFAAQSLRELGALDVWQVPAAMKKGRLGIELRVLADPTSADALERAVHDHTGSPGVRRTPMTRSVLEREVRSVEGPWGAFRVKVSGEGAALRIRPEHDDIARIAREQGAPYRTIAEELTRIARSSVDGSE